MGEADRAEANRICHTAFGTFLGAPEPEKFWADLDYVHGRFGAEHVRSFTVERGGEVVGSNFATRWGSVGFFGPLTTRPDLWDRGLAQPLVCRAVCDAFDDWRVGHAGLFTFADSAKHVHLYREFGFYPRFLTAIMAAPTRAAEATRGSTRYSELSPSDRHAAEAACRKVTEACYDGLDLGAEIRTVTERASATPSCCGTDRAGSPGLRYAIGDRRTGRTIAATAGRASLSSTLAIAVIASQCRPRGEADAAVILAIRDLDRADAGRRRALGAGRDHRVDALGGTGGGQLDGTVGAVAHPAPQAEAAGGFDRPGAVADALYPPTDHHPHDPQRTATRIRE
jgi:hypothetical protein